MIFFNKKTKREVFGGEERKREIYSPPNTRQQWGEKGA
jgi:hypothetical protein